MSFTGADESVAEEIRVVLPYRRLVGIGAESLVAKAAKKNIYEQTFNP